METQFTHHNTLIKKKPIGVLYCNSAEDVIMHLNNSHVQEVGFTVRGGGHNHEALCVENNKYIIDISGIKAYTVCSKTNTVSVGAGLSNLEIIYLQSKLNPSRIVSTGECPSVGTAGYTLGGGWHLHCRDNGLSSDSVESFEMVHYDKTCENSKVEFKKSIIDKSHEEFYNILGAGGGNFGIVTSITYKTFTLQDMYDVEVLCDYPLIRENEVIEDISNWLDFQQNSTTFTSITRLVRIDNKLRVRILARVPQNELRVIIKKIRSIDMLNQYAKVSSNKYNPYAIKELTDFQDELKELDKLIVDSEKNKFCSFFVDYKQSKEFSNNLQSIYQDIKRNGKENNIEKYLGSSFYYELSHQQDSFLIQNSSNYSCRTPRNHKVTSTFINKEACLEKAVERVVNYMFDNTYGGNNYSICSIHTMPAQKACKDKSTYLFEGHDFLVQIQSWLPEAYNTKKDEKLESEMIDWVNNFRQHLIKSKLFSGAFINFINKDIPLEAYYNGTLEALIECKQRLDPHNCFNSGMSISIPHIEAVASE